MIEKAKRIAAGLLLIASLLPLAQCKSKEPVQPRNTEARTTLQEQENSQHPPMGHSIHVWQAFKTSDPQTWVFALAFVWPVPLILTRWKSPSRQTKITTNILEIPLCAFTGYLLYCFIRDPLWQLLSGGYAAVAGTTVYAVAMVVDVANWQRKKPRTEEP